MKIDNKKIPITATHYCFESGEFLRLGKGIYAEVYLNDRFWTECVVLRNYELPMDGYMPVGYKYQFIGNRKSRFGRFVCNIRLMLIGFDYRV